MKSQHARLSHLLVFLSWLATLHLCLLGLGGSSCSAFSLIKGTDALSTVARPQRRPQGSAATPAAKKKVAVMGSGGYLGAITFGFLQRAASLFGTGIGNCRCIGATPDTAVRLNRLLSKHFCLAQADESFIKLADLMSVEAVVGRLQGWDALIFGTDFYLDQRPVGAGSYERTPNDKAWELYWDEPKGAFTDLSLSQEARTVKSQLLQNVLIAAKEANIQHMVVVDDGSFLPQLKACGVPFTCIRTPQVLKDSKDFTFKDGIVDDVTIAPWDVGSDPTSTTATAVCREDLAALCVQCLLSLRWDESRQLSVSSNGPVKIPVVSVQVGRPVLRVDQKWCVNSSILEDKLSVLS